MTLAKGEVEILPIRLVAARFVAKHEKDGTDDLAALTSDVFAAIRPRYLAWLLVLGVGAAFSLLAIALSVTAIFSEPTNSNWPYFTISAFALGWFVLLLVWRWFQYGFGWVQVPLPAIYAKNDSLFAKNLDLFFEVLQRDTKLRAFYYDRSGRQRFVRRQHFFGRLRVLMLAEHGWIREPVFSPSGLWFARELFIEADVTALIAQAKAKPKAGGRPKEIDYEAIALRLLEHCSLKNFDHSQNHAETRMMELIRDVCMADEDQQTDLRVPEGTELRKFTKKILSGIEKNRSLKK